MAIVFAGGCSQPPVVPADGSSLDSGAEGGAKEVLVDTEALKQRVLAKDWEAVEEAKKLGAAALPALEAGLADPDPEVRRIAVSALGEVGGDQAAALLVTGIKDADINVRTMAMAGLDRCATASVKAPLEALLPTSTDEVIRARVALVLGRIGDQGTVAVLAAHEKVESDGAALADVRLALAKLGDPKQRADILAELGSATVDVRHRAVKKLGYIADPKLLHHLLPLTDDNAGVRNIAPSHAQHLMLRIKDVVVIVTAAVTHHRFSFDATQTRLYSDAEIAEVKALLASLPR